MFKLKGQERADLRAMMRELEDDGLLMRGHKKRVRAKGRLPGVVVAEVTGMDDDGELVARPASEQDEGVSESRILLSDGGRGRAPKVGDRVLARLRHVEGQVYEGQVIKILPRTPDRVVGVLEQTRSGLVVRSLDRGAMREFRLDRSQAGDAAPGDLVVVAGEEDRPLDRGSVKITERLGRIDDASAISLLAAHQQDLRIAFPPEVLEAADEAEPVALGQRKDLRDLPLVTIDGADARDFDDAVFARPDDDKGNPGGWRITVAIADVAHYVRPNGPLDVEAKARGNSTYFPDRVLPMLPEALSNGLCSLRPDEDRACLAVHIWLDAQGRKQKHRFERGLMRSRTRLTYEQVQAARDGRPDVQTEPMVDSVITPLYGAFS
ncbi:MAG: RNB domain-containing ribonuclease, partial [Pseudomonadota bacterium]